jgi:bifunctional non-homologous end joining protein LigD
MSADPDQRVEVEVDGRPLALSSLDKPLYPSGFTKGDLIDYYARVAPALVPHVGRSTRDPAALPRGPRGTDVVPDPVSGKAVVDADRPGEAPPR